MFWRAEEGQVRMNCLLGNVWTCAPFSPFAGAVFSARTSAVGEGGCTAQASALPEPCLFLAGSTVFERNKDSPNRTFPEQKNMRNCFFLETHYIRMHWNVSFSAPTWPVWRKNLGKCFSFFFLHSLSDATHALAGLLKNRSRLVFSDFSTSTHL